MQKHRMLHDMIRNLVAIPSVSSVLPELDQSNKAVIETLANWLSDDGFQIDILPVDSEEQKYNLIAVKGRGNGGLVLSGHTDTVPLDPELWRFDPFTLTEVDNRLYGLGAADMKAFFAPAIMAARSFPTDQLNEPLIILATADEESTMSGAKMLVSMDKPRARSAVIGEPTGNQPVRMHKGIMMERIEIHGQSGHSSNPALGQNALEGMHIVLTELLAFREEWQTRYHNELFQVPAPTLNLGHIHGGDNPNRICGHCVLDIDLRPLPGMDIDELRQILHARLRRSLENRKLELQFTTLFSGIPAMETETDREIVTLAESLTGQQAGAVAFGTEAPYLQALGMDVVIMGPGHIDQAHQPNEYVDSADIAASSSLLEQLIYKHCVVGR